MVSEGPGKKIDNVQEYQDALSFLSHRFEDLTDFSPDADIYSYIAKSLSQVTPDGTIILVNSLDPEKRIVTLQAIEGVGPWLPEIENLFGRPLLGITFPVPDPAMIPLRTGSCDELHGGLSTLTFGAVPESICRKVEGMPFFGKVYGTGISWKGVLHGAATFILPRGQDLENQQVISLFIRHVAGYLQRRQADLTIKDHYTTLKGIIGNSDSPIFSVDTNYCYTSFNESHAAVMMALYGAHIETGGNLLDYMTVDDDRIKAKGNIDRGLSGEHFTDQDYSGEDTRTRLFFEISHNPIKNNQGQVTGVAVYARDITRRRQTEIALQDSEVHRKSPD